ADSDCNGKASCVCLGGGVESTSGQCTDGVDNDCDGTTDCADSNCTGVSCGSGGYVCSAGGTCGCPGSIENTSILCSDAADDDCDGFTDCADPGCNGLVCGIGTNWLCTGGSCVCSSAGGENTSAHCMDAVDNDCDNTADCADTGCNGIQ